MKSAHNLATLGVAVFLAIQGATLASDIKPADLTHVETAGETTPADKGGDAPSGPVPDTPPRSDRGTSGPATHPGGGATGGAGQQGSGGETGGSGSSGQSTSYTPIATGSVDAVDETPSYSLECKIFGNSEPGFNYVKFTNTSKFILPAGTKVALNMPDGTIYEFLISMPLVPGGSGALVDEFRDGIPEGFDCTFTFVVP